MKTIHIAAVRPISPPTKEYWLETTERMEEKYDVLEARAERIESIDDFDLDGDIAYFEASPSGFKDLVYARVETEHGEHPVRTLFGKQYTQRERSQYNSETVQETVEQEEPVKMAADGGTRQRDRMNDVDHESPLNGVQETLERGE